MLNDTSIEVRLWPDPPKSTMIISSLTPVRKRLARNRQPGPSATLVVDLRHVKARVFLGNLLP